MILRFHYFYSHRFWSSFVLSPMTFAYTYFSRCDHIFSFYPSFQTFLPKLWDYYYDAYSSISSHDFPSKIGQPSKLYISMCGPFFYTYPSCDEYPIWCTSQYLMPYLLRFAQSLGHHIQNIFPLLSNLWKISIWSMLHHLMLFPSRTP